MLVTYIHTRERARAKERARARERERGSSSSSSDDRRRRLHRSLQKSASAINCGRPHAQNCDTSSCFSGWTCMHTHSPSLLPFSAWAHPALIVIAAGRGIRVRGEGKGRCMTGGWMWSKIPPVMPPLYYRSVQPAFAITAEPIPWRGRFIDGGVTGFTVSVGVPQIQLPKHPHLPLPHAPTSARVFPSAIRPCQSDLRFPCPGCRPGLLSVFPPASPFSSLNCCGRGAGFRIDVQ